MFYISKIIYLASLYIGEKYIMVMNSIARASESRLSARISIFMLSGKSLIFLIFTLNLMTASLHFNQNWFLTTLSAFVLVVDWCLFNVFF